MERIRLDGWQMNGVNHHMEEYIRSNIIQSIAQQMVLGYQEHLLCWWLGGGVSFLDEPKVMSLVMIMVMISTQTSASTTAAGAGGVYLNNAYKLVKCI